MKVEYSSNNSGGSWWLDDADWIALEKAGWQVNWSRDQDRFGKKTIFEIYDKFSIVPLCHSGDSRQEERWLGALATSASRDGLSLRDAVQEWEKVTGKCSTDAGCPCCGQPHSFTLYDDDGKYVDSGPEVSYSASW